MTRPKPLRLVPLDIPVDTGIAKGNGCDFPAPSYRLGLDESGTLYLTFQMGPPWTENNRSRLSVKDPRWNANHGLRYVEWVTPC